MLKKLGSVEYEDFWSDGYLIRKIYINKAGIYKDLGISVGFRTKLVDNTHKLIVNVKEPKVEFSIQTDEFLKEAVKDDFVGKYPNDPMKFYYFPIYSYLTK